MLTICLREEDIGYRHKQYVPLTKSDLMLMQHMMNEDLISLNEDGLDKARYIAAAHGWEVSVL